MLRFNGSLLPTKGEKKNAGFSLVELMVVVAIIGILAALAIGRFGNMTVNARRSEAFANLNQIRTLTEVWGQDNNHAYAGANLAGLANAAARMTAIGFTVPNGARFNYDVGLAAAVGTIPASQSIPGGYSGSAVAIAGQVCEAGAANALTVGLDAQRGAGPIWMSLGCTGAGIP